ncbi:MAG: hypothetical protein JWR61_4745 [Ferruginibacter sp.]|nr:hypothetical protein [Ferruginibacter sp.]
MAAELILAIILFLLALVKVLLFVKIRSHSMVISRIIYFSHFSIVNSRNEYSRRFKITQNRLSIAFFLILIPEIFMFLINHVWSVY